MTTYPSDDEKGEKLYSIDNSRADYLEVVFAGVLTGPIGIEMLQEMSQMEEYLNKPILINFSGLTGNDTGASEMEKYISTVEKINSKEMPRQGRRIALFAPSDLDFGLSRMFEVLSSRLPSDHQVFRDRESAVTWLIEDH